MKNMNTLPRFFRRLLKEFPLLVLVALLAGSALSLFQVPVAWAATPIYVRPDGDDINCNGTANVAYSGGGPGLACAVKTIQQGISLVDPGGTVNVAAGTYTEEVNINKAAEIRGAGIDQSYIVGRKDAGGANTVTFGTNNALLDGFTITREGNNTTDWATNVKSQGVIFNQGTTGNTLQNCKVTGNRNGVYLNNTGGHTIKNNIITFNRTGVQFANNVSNNVFQENEITDNWTMGILFNFDSPALVTNNIDIHNNAISGNWYGEVQCRWTNSTATLNLSGNWFGATTITKSNTNSAEPGYTALIPVTYGGTATNPGGAAMIGGTCSNRIDYTPWLNTGTDTAPATLGFQGDFSVLNADDDSPQTGTTGRVQEGISLVTSGGTVHVAAGTYPEVGQVVIAKNLTLVGEDRDSTIVQPTANTGSTGDARGWFLVNAGVEFNLSNVTLDGSGYNIYQAIRSNGSGVIENNIFKNIRYAKYLGMGVVIYDDMTIRNNMFENIERLGIIAFGANVTNALIEGNTYTGKGAGDWLDYGVEVGGGAVVIISGNVISNNVGVATTDGSTSAGILLTTYFGPGTQATVLENTLMNNTTGIEVGYNESDTSTVIAHFNRIVGNETGISSTAPTVDAINNWWGCNEGPAGADCDPVNALVDADPWLVLSAVAVPATIQPSGTSVVTADLIFNSAAMSTSGAGYVPNGIPLSFTAPDGGTVNPSTGATLNGAANTTFTAPVVDQAYQVCTEVDNELHCVNLMVTNYYSYLPILRK